MMQLRTASCLAALLTLAACMPANEHARAVSTGSQDRLTVGTVQREIRQGMTGAEVAAALGSPNIVTSDERRRETWVYDRIATERAYSDSSGGVNALFLAGAVQRAGASQTSQRTLTIIIKFDPNGRVENFTYRSSSF
jgi:outer membrane protein assembly factor BamE (lipoprotein component of BamABCDE complex)